MDFQKYEMILKQVVGEFHFLNKHFDSKEGFTVLNYDTIFSNWRRDMFKKYREVTLTMHWASEGKVISNNQIFLDVIHRSQYLFEIKYSFSEELSIGFEDFLKNAEVFNKAFSEFSKSFDCKDKTITDFDKQFYAWRAITVTIPEEWIMDISWEKNDVSITDNSVFLNIIFKDEYLLQIKYYYNKKVGSFDELTAQEELEM